MTFTKGPWEWQSNEECLVGPEQIVMRKDGAGRMTFAEYPEGDHEANANLIATAPELFEALEALVIEYCDYARINNLGDPEQQHNIKLARAALSRARGEV